MTLDDVVKELTDYKDKNPGCIVDDVFMRGKAAGIDRALRLIEKVDRDPPGDTELERRAWEIYCHFAHRSSKDSFQWALEWIDERDKRRTASEAVL